MNERFFRVIRVDVVDLKKKEQVLEVPERSREIRRLAVRQRRPERGQIRRGRSPAFRRTTELDDARAHIWIAEVLGHGVIGGERRDGPAARFGFPVSRGGLQGVIRRNVVQESCQPAPGGRELTGSEAKKPASRAVFRGCLAGGVWIERNGFGDRQCLWQVDCTSHVR